MWKYAYALTRSPQPPTTPRRRKNMRKYWRDLAARRALAGLTTRGTIPKRRLEHRVTLAAIDALAVDLAKSFDLLSPSSQTQVLQLEASLIALRKQIV